MAPVARWQDLLTEKKTWLITGVAGFIGSHLLETLLKHQQNVLGVDNFITGSKANLEDVKNKVGPNNWKFFQFHEASILDAKKMAELIKLVDIILHQAALGSVPRSIHDPMTTFEHNINGTLTLLNILRNHPDKRFVYASSSSVYGDDAGLPKVEERLGKQLSPYAVSKRVNEIQASNFCDVYKIQVVGLRYFNVFGPRQNPEGPYAAVIPKWISSLSQDEPAIINGDGSNSRDFCYVENVVQMNIRCALSQDTQILGDFFNVAVGHSSTLNELHDLIQECLLKKGTIKQAQKPSYAPFRKGDVAHSLANIGKAQRLLGYEPEFDIRQGLEKTIL